MFKLEFWKQSLERAVKTFAQTAGSLFAANSVNILNTDWVNIVGISLGSGVLSILTSIASLPVGEKNSPSILNK
jgi:hypothetical protein